MIRNTRGRNKGELEEEASIALRYASEFESGQSSNELRGKIFSYNVPQCTSHPKLPCAAHSRKFLASYRIQFYSPGVISKSIRSGSIMQYSCH